MFYFIGTLKAPWKSLYVNLPFERLALSESSSAVTLLLHADWMMLKNASHQAHEIPAADAGRIRQHVDSESKREYIFFPWHFKVGFQRVFEPLLRGFQSVSTF